MPGPKLIWQLPYESMDVVNTVPERRLEIDLRHFICSANDAGAVSDLRADCYQGIVLVFHNALSYCQNF